MLAPVALRIPVIFSILMAFALLFVFSGFVAASPFRLVGESGPAESIPVNRRASIYFGCMVMVCMIDLTLKELRTRIVTQPHLPAMRKFLL